MLDILESEYGTWLDRDELVGRVELLRPSIAHQTILRAVARIAHHPRVQVERRGYPLTNRYMVEERTYLSEEVIA